MQAEYNAFSKYRMHLIEIASSSEEMTVSTDEVASAAQELSNMTKKMMESVSKFKL